MKNYLINCYNNYFFWFFMDKLCIQRLRFISVCKLGWNLSYVGSRPERVNMHKSQLSLRVIFMFIKLYFIFFCTLSSQITARNNAEIMQKSHSLHLKITNILNKNTVFVTNGEKNKCIPVLVTIAIIIKC